MDKAQQDALKKAAGIEAAKLIQNGMIAGLGTGSTDSHFASPFNAPNAEPRMIGVSSPGN